MINYNLQQSRHKLYVKYLIFTVLFSIGSLLCYSQKKHHDFDINKHFSYPTVLRISIQSQDHGRTFSVEEFFIHPTKISETIYSYKIHNIFSPVTLYSCNNNFPIS